MSIAAHRDLPFLHGFQERGLRLGGSSVHFVGEDDIREDRPAQKLELPDARRLVFLDHLGAGDVRGHQVGSELDAVVAQVQSVGKGVDHQRLGQSRDTDQ